jgi:hypothetical protein
VRTSSTLAAAFLLACSFALAGCSPAVDGAIGVTLAANGQPTAVLASCSRTGLSRIFVGIDHPDREAVDKLLELRRRTPLRKSGGVEFVHLTNPDEPWSRFPAGEVMTFDRSIQYLISASDATMAAGTGGTLFSLVALGKMKEGVVLASIDGTDRALTVQQFANAACK